MKKIIVAADALESIANDIFADCAMLDYVDADMIEESISDVEFYAARIRDSVERLRRVVFNAEPVKNE